MSNNNAQRPKKKYSGALCLEKDEISFSNDIDESGNSAAKNGGPGPSGFKNISNPTQENI